MSLIIDPLSLFATLGTVLDLVLLDVALPIATLLTSLAILLAVPLTTALLTVAPLLLPLGDPPLAIHVTIVRLPVANIRL